MAVSSHTKGSLPRIRPKPKQAVEALKLNRIKNDKFIAEHMKLLRFFSPKFKTLAEIFRLKSFRHFHSVEKLDSFAFNYSQKSIDHLFRDQNNRSRFQGGSREVLINLPGNFNSMRPVIFAGRK